MTAAAEDEVEPISTTGPDFAQQLDSNVTQQREAERERRSRYELEMLKDEMRR